jgi:hypothetical protein
MATLALLGAGIAYQQYASSIGADTLSSRLRSVSVDLECTDATAFEVTALLRQKLVEADPWFANCDFQFDVTGSQARISMVLHDASGLDCLRYVTELAQSRYCLKRRVIVIAPLGADIRGPLERATDAAYDRAKEMWCWVNGQFGHNPGPPIDPFAP